MGLLLSSIVATRWRLVLFLALGLFVTALAWLCLEAFAAEYLIGYFGYYAIFGVVLVTSAALGRAIDWRSFKSGWNRRRYFLLGLLGIVSFLTLKLEPMDFKVVMDEPMLASVSTSMHLDRLALYPGRGHELSGTYMYLDGKVDKRPLLYPFLVSILHDFTGHRIGNSFLLNALLVPVFWLLVFSLGRRFGGGRDWGGLLTVALVFTAPLVAHLATSGGFDFLNTTLLLGALYWAIRWREVPENEALFGALVASLVLLGNVRYESPFWILPFGLFILWMWWRRKCVSMPTIVVMAPLLMLPALVHNRVHSQIPMWQDGIFDRAATFSASYIMENLEGAGIYFFGLGDKATNSYLLSVLAFAGMLTVAGYLITLRWNRTARLTPPEEVGIFFYLGLAGLFVIMMTFNWGYFANYITARLSFSFVIGTAFTVAWALWRAPRVFGSVAAVLAVILVILHVEAFSDQALWERGIYFLLASFILLPGLGFLVLRDRVEAKWFLWLALAYGALVTVPRLNVHAYLQSYLPRTEVNLLLDFIAEHEDEDCLIVSHFPYVAALKFTPTVSTQTFLESKDLFRERIVKQRAYDAVYYYHVSVYDPEKETWKIYYAPDLKPHFELELVDSHLIGPFRQAHFYRVIDIRPEVKTSREKAKDTEGAENPKETVGTLTAPSTLSTGVTY